MTMGTTCHKCRLWVLDRMREKQGTPRRSVVDENRYLRQLYDELKQTAEVMHRLQDHDGRTSTFINVAKEVSGYSPMSNLLAASPMSNLLAAVSAVYRFDEDK